MKNLQAYGTWKVTTEGDCEGRTTTHLGEHTGYIDDIAFALAARAYYSLRFSAVEPMVVDGSEKTGTYVSVSLDIETGSWDMPQARRVAYFKKLLAGRPVHVQEGQYYASVVLVDGTSPEAQAEAKRKLIARAAIAKLSPDEREALGV